jgi:hypothetical protein
MYAVGRQKTWSRFTMIDFGPRGSVGTFYENLINPIQGDRAGSELSLSSLLHKLNIE